VGLNAANIARKKKRIITKLPANTTKLHAIPSLFLSGSCHRCRQGGRAYLKEAEAKLVPRNGGF
jgi:hypothetical protein